jgi:hypothetical protein
LCKYYFHFISPSIDDIAKAIVLEIHVSTPTLDFEVQSVSWDYLEWNEGEKE